MKISLQNAVEIIKMGGIVTGSYWSSGKGRYSSPRKTPAHCERFENRCHKNNENVKKFFMENPRVRTVVAFVGSEDEKQNLLNDFLLLSKI